MALIQGLVPLAAVRHGSALLLGPLAALLILFAVACGEEGGKESTAPTGEQAAVAQTITVYSSPTCGCCREYERYLEAEGFEVESIKTEEFTEVTDSLGVPLAMRSCHIAIIDEYFVEGHVPVEAIWKLLEEQPAIDGIALPGMPSGSPGMAGIKAQPLIIYGVVEGRIDEFMTL
ncbi:MAG: hypothetical protein E3J29_04100 [Dehalococcoidia bacterium]|nr:MAG: hypothetical protein E3J29_04100 [Dehalococcoidia bacterium]